MIYRRRFDHWVLSFSLFFNFGSNTTSIVLWSIVIASRYYMTIELRSVASSQTIEMNFHEVNKTHMHFISGMGEK